MAFYYKDWTSEVVPRRSPFSQAPRAGLQFFILRGGMSYLLDPEKGRDLYEECREKIQMGYAQLCIFEHIAAFTRGKNGIIGWPEDEPMAEAGEYKLPESGTPVYSKLDRQKWQGRLYYAWREPKFIDSKTWSRFPDSFLIGTTTDRREALTWAYWSAARSKRRRTLVGKLIGDIQWH